MSTTTPAGTLRAEVARRLFEVMAHGSLDDFAAIVHPQATNREALIEPPACRGRGPAAWFATACWLRNMSEDLHFEPHELVIDGDLAAVHLTMTGHQTGDHAHHDAAGAVSQIMPGTGRPFSVTQTHWLRFEDGKLIEHWANRDDLAMAMQLGWVGGVRPMP